LEILHYDGSGIVIVGWMVPEPNPTRWRTLAEIEDRARRRSLQDEMIDIYIEAIDTDAGIVLASMGPVHPSVAAPSVPTGFVPRSRLGYRRDEAPDGTQILRIIELRLTGRR
jgi:hypothetical protein